MSVFTFDTDGQLWRVDVDTDGLITTTAVSTPSSGSSGPAPTFTADDIIRRAMRKISALPSGEDPTDDELADHLKDLNAMIGQWNAEKLMLNAYLHSDHAVSTAQLSYTIGPSGDFNITRPAKIDAVGLIVSSSPEREYPVKMLSPIEWSRECAKETTSYALACFDDGGSPQRTLSFIGLPTEATAARLYQLGQLTRFADLDTEYNFAPEYEEALVYNLAVRISPEHQGDLSAVVASIAESSKEVIRKANLRPIPIEPDYITGVHGWVDIATGSIY